MREMTLSEAWDDGHETGVSDQKKADKEFREAVQKFVDKMKQVEEDLAKLKQTLNQSGD